MKIIQLFIFLSSSLLFAQEIPPNGLSAKVSNESRLEKSFFVDPFIGTGGHGHTYPGASAPFGFMQLSPDTRYDGWDGCGGYHYSDDFIYGFSHTHLSGTGVSDYADLLVVPQSGKLNTVPGYKEKSGFGSHFRHETETASPGFYSVHLDDENIDVRLTTRVHSGMHEYTFHNQKEKKFIILDLDYRDALLGYSMIVESENQVSGSRISSAWAEEQHFYFFMETNIPFLNSKIIDENGKHQIILEFPKKTTQIVLKVGISAVDVDGAINNLVNEIPESFTFDQVHDLTKQTWEQELSKIDFQSKDLQVNRNFYTALYHAFLAPNTFSDVDGRYRGRDKLIHQLDPKIDCQYTVFSLWDTYRAANPLYTLIQQKRTNDFIRTFQRQYDEGGDLPVWELAGNETECMIGFHSVSVIADAYIKGIRDYDFDKILAACVHTSEVAEYGKEHFNTDGYISLDREHESVSKALEYSYDNFCIAELFEMKGLDNPENFKNYQKFKQRSLNFVNHFDPQTKFMRARKSGMWYAPFDPAEVNFNYTEANSWQYSLYAPHAISELRELLGGKDSLELWLDRLFSTESKTTGREQVDITGLIGQYAHGNEPSHHMAYLYNYTNAPSKAQSTLDRIMREMYHNAPDGLSGNEDCGQMSAWYVLSAMGLYQISPGVPSYEIGRPMMDKALIKLENGKEFLIVATNNSETNMFLQKIILNGREITSTNISHQQIMEGGRLELVMGDKANNKLKNKTAKSKINGQFTPIPYFENSKSTFTDSISVSINFPKAGSNPFQIRYTLDGSEPKISSNKFLIPILLRESTTVKAALYNPQTKKMGRSVETSFVKLDTNLQIRLKSEYASQYSAGGQDALIDGIIGGNDYRTGEWQGFQDKDLEATLRFTQAKKIDTLQLSFLQDTRSWIFAPEKVQLKVTYENGKSEVMVREYLTKKEDNSIRKINFSFSLSEMKIKSIEIKAEHVPEIPEWHLSPGNFTWLFVDEIVVKEN